MSTRGCQKDQVGTVVASGLGQTSDLIFVTVSIAGVEVVALVDTGATTSCCRWEWYQQWKDHLGDVIKSKVRIMSVGPDPIKIKGLTKPLTLQWDGVGGEFQLMILTALTDVDVVLGMDVLSQFDVKINFKKQVGRPAREPCTPLEPAKTVGLLLDNPGFTFKGKIPVKEEGVEEVAKDVLRPAYREVNRVWLASKRKRKDLRIAPESFMPWDKAGYKDQLKRDLEDIRQKLSQVLGRDLGKSGHLNVEATSPVNCIEGGILVDLCKQRSGERGSGCNAPDEIYKSPTLANVSWRSSEGSPIPVTSPLVPPKPARTGRKRYSWRNPSKKDVCMHIRIFNPWEIRKEKKELTFKSQESTNCQHGIGDDDIIASSKSDVTLRRDTLSAVGINRLVARKRLMTTEQLLSSSVENSRKLWKAYKGFISLIAVYLAIIVSVLGGLTKLIRCERKSIVGNSRKFFASESQRNVCAPFPFFIFHECLSMGSRFNKELWLREITYRLWERNKLIRKRKEELWSFGVWLVIAMKWLRNLQLGNVSKGTFSIRSGNTAETFLAGKRSKAYFRLFSDLCASCHVKLRSYTINLEFSDKFKIIYNRIYSYIYDLYRCLLSCKWASYPGALAVKTYTLVYFSSKASLLMIKSYDKNQSIDLIGLAHVEKAYSRNWLFLGHNRPYWRELRPLVTPWAWWIKEGTDPWKGQKRALLSHVQVGLLPLSLSSPSLALLCFYDAFVIIIIINCIYLLVKGIITVTGKPSPEYSKW